MQYKSFRKGMFILTPVYLVVFCAFFDTHAQMPVLAPYTTAMGATPFLLGLVIGFYSLFNILGNYTGGLLIDRQGWQLPLFLGLTGATISLLLYALAGNAYHLIIIRAGHGFVGGLLVPAALAFLITGNNVESLYNRRLALFGAVIGLAAVTGPLFAGIIAGRMGFQAVYYLLSLFMASTLLTSLLLLKKQDASGKNAISPPISIKWITARPRFRGALIFALGTMGSTGTLASFLPLRAELLGLDHVRTGILFATFAVTAIVIQLLWPWRLKSLFKKDLSGCTIGLAFIICALVLAALAPNASWLFAAMILYGSGFGFSFQGMLGMVMEDSNPAWRGRAIGVFFAAYSLGVAIMPPLSGLIWQYTTIIFPFYTSAGFALLSLGAGKNICPK